MTSRPAPAAASPSTATRILDVAEGLAQTRGFNGFSYADIAAEIGITKASLHYHFPSKADLGRALVRRYTERFMDALDAIEASDVPKRRGGFGKPKPKPFPTSSASRSVSIRELAPATTSSCTPETRTC